MVEDLLLRYNLKEKNKQEIIDYLGEPSELTEKDGNDKITYWLGYQYVLFGPDASKWLVIMLDNEQRVMQYEKVINRSGVSPPE